jgi:hypothetical protein
MEPTDILPFVTGAGGALFVLIFGLYLFVSGKILPESVHDKAMDDKDVIITDKNKQIDLLTRALDRERDRNEAGVLAAQTATTVLRALHQEVERH